MKVTTGLLLLLTISISMGGCKETAAPFETIDELSVLNRADLHGQLGHLIQIQSTPGGQGGGATTVYAKVFDQDISDAPYYLQWRHIPAQAPDYLSAIAAVLDRAEAIALVDELPEGVSLYEEVVIGKPNTTAERVTHCLEVTTADGVFYVGVHIVFTDGVLAWFATKLSQPLRILLLEEQEDAPPTLLLSLLPEVVRTTLVKDDDGTATVLLQKDVVTTVPPQKDEDTLILAAYSREVLEPPPEVTPAQVVAISYYLDETLTQPLTDVVMVGDTVCTKVTFSKDVPLVVADDGRAQPRISSTVGSRTFQYRMKPHGAALESGAARPYRDSHHIFVGVYRVLGRDFHSEFHTSAGRPAVSGNSLRVMSYLHDPDDIPPNTGTTIVDWHPADFVGQVYTVPFNGETEDRSASVPIPGVTVTIMAGTRAGERIVTDRNGRYRFLNIPGDSLHLRAERPRFEPKEVLVYRSQPTALSDGSVPNYWGDPQKQPGNILIGQRWPDEVRFILEETLLPYDLLYVESGTNDYAIGHYGDGYIRVYSDSMRTPILLSTLGHELMHARQHAVASIDGTVAPSEAIWVLWPASPEGRSFAEARAKDWAEVGKVAYDHVPHYRDQLHESAAEVASYYWGNRWRAMQRYNNLEELAPHRYRWAAEWLSKK